MGHHYLPAMILVLLVAVFLEAVFYGFGSAVQRLKKEELRQSAKQGDERARKLLGIMEKPDRFINTLQIFTHLIGMITGAYVFKALDEYLLWQVELRLGMKGPLTEAVLFCMIIFVMIMLLISFGNIIPKCLAEKNPREWANRCLGIVLLVAALLRPATSIIYGFCMILLRVIGKDHSKE